jgi:integrase
VPWAKPSGSSQQVHREKPLIVSYLKTDAAYRDIDLHPEVAEYLRVFIRGEDGLLFKTRNGTPHLHNNIEERWLTERLTAMQLDEPGMGWHAFRRFRNTWLRGRRCQEDIKNFWMGHKLRTMSELYSHLFEDVELRLAESAQVGAGFDIPAYVAPNCSKGSVLSDVQVNMEVV